MPLVTTTIGAYPKPDYVHLPDWFAHPDGPDCEDPTATWAQAWRSLGADAEQILDRGVREAVLDQVEAGVDIPTDGEIARENYIHYHCRHLHGISFHDRREKSLRSGAYNAKLPTVIAPIKADTRFLIDDWRRAQATTKRPVKITMPGPMTIADTTVDAYYNDRIREGADLADALNQEVIALAEAGCRHIQIDEPLFARNPDAALAYGIEHIERAFHRCQTGVTRTLHICCGYPDRLDNPNYPKAPPESYATLADAIDTAAIDAVSIEDAHCPNDLALLERYPRTQVIIGVVAIAKSRVESIEEITYRLQQALEHIDPPRLIAAPDCGLGLLGRELAQIKLHNLCAAAKNV